MTLKAVKPRKSDRTNRPARVEDTESSGNKVARTAQHRQARNPVQAIAHDLGGGEVLISAQMSELVPVAQYANVTLGPNQLAFKIQADMSVLADADWDGGLSSTQQGVYDTVRGSLAAASQILKDHIGDDYESVLASVQQRNAREASSAKKKTR